MGLSEWPGFRIFLILVLWVVGVFIVAAWRVYWAVARTVADEGSAAVAMHLKWPMLIALGPPLLLAAAWLVVRLRAGKARA